MIELDAVWSESYCLLSGLVDLDFSDLLFCCLNVLCCFAPQKGYNVPIYVHHSSPSHPCFYFCLVMIDCFVGIVDMICFYYT